MSTRYEGDTVRNPILVLSDSEIPRKLIYTFEDEGEEHSWEFEFPPSKKYYPYSEEFPDVPPIIVIDAADARSMVARNNADIEIPDDFLGLFIIRSIRLGVIQSTMRDDSAWHQGTQYTFEKGFYFVGDLDTNAGRYCRDSALPVIKEYSINSERPLEIYFGGQNLAVGTEKVLFEFPNGVIKEATIKKMAQEQKRLLTREQLWRKVETENEERKILRDNISRRVQQSGITVLDMSIFDAEASEPGKSGEPFYLKTAQLVESMKLAGVQFEFKKMQVIGGSDAAEKAVETIGNYAAAGAGIGSVLGLPGPGTVTGAVLGTVVGAVVATGTALGGQVNIYKDQFNIFNYAVPVDLSRELGLRQISD